MKELSIALTSAAPGALLVPASPGLTSSVKALKVDVRESAASCVDEIEPGLGPDGRLPLRDPVVDTDGNQIGTAVTRVRATAPAGVGDSAIVVDCTVELNTGRLAFTGVELFSPLESGTTHALVSGTDAHAGVMGQVVVEPALDDQRASERTFELGRE